MARIVIITSHMAGRINATAELTRRLRERGHDITLASPVDIGDRLEHVGLDFRYIGPPSGQTGSASPAKPSLLLRLVRLIRRLASLKTVAARRATAVEQLRIDDFRSVMSELEADLYLVDIELPTHVMVVARSGTPLAVWTTMLSLWKRPGLPPLHTDIVPGAGWRGTRPGIELAWLRFRTWKWLRNQRLRITRVGTDQMSVLRQVAEQTGFSLDDEAAAFHWLIPFVYRSIPTLMFNAREIEFPHDPDPVCRYVGPILNAARRQSDADASQLETTDRLQRIYDRVAADPSRRLVYCSFGAWHKGDDLDFFRRVIAAARRSPDWEMVIGLGGRVVPDRFPDVPANVHLFRWAPQLEVLGKAHLAVHHAGISTINEAVVSGVPMVVFPYGYGDTTGAAARVEYHGIGLRGNRKSDTEERIHALMQTVLTEPRFRNNVAEMRRAYQRYEEDNAPIVEIESLLDDRLR